MPKPDEPRYLGLDLAWGQGAKPARTGLAVLDAAGRLIESMSVRTDAEIAEFVARHDSSTLVAAMDAPLVVPNEAGRRPCEAMVGAEFGRFGAGAYPANRGNPSFSPAPRGAKLAHAFGWDMDPAAGTGKGLKVCIEVYPHPAMVSLFPLDYVIPYKAKQGRDLAGLKVAFGRLLTGMESTCGHQLALPESQRWQGIRAIATQAARKSELDAIEDEIDAIFCAYLAWLWATEPARMRVYGDYAAGYIVTPHPPNLDVIAGRPAPRAPAQAPRAAAQMPTMNARLRRHFTELGNQRADGHAIYADDAVLHYMHSGERLHGRANIEAAHREYPGRPAVFEVHRVECSEHAGVVEMTLRFGGIEPHAVVAVLELREHHIVTERRYIAEPGKPAAYRARWVQLAAGGPSG